jgi:hypothetical protein
MLKVREPLLTDSGVHKTHRKQIGLRVVGAALLGLVLLWLVISHSLVAYVADVEPSLALRMNSNDPEALLNAANETLKRANIQLAPLQSGNVLSKLSGVAARATTDAEATSGGATPPIQEPRSEAEPLTLDRARALTEKALVRDPLSARAFRLLGQIAATTGKSVLATTFMQRAAQGSNHESIAVYWLMRKSFEDADYPKAAYYADVLLRAQPQAMPLVAPVLGALLEIKEANSEVKKLLSANPLWRSSFLAVLPSTVRDFRTPLDILLTLKDTPHPPMSSDLRAYLDFLSQNRLYELAYYTWLQFLPMDQLQRAGLLFNGSFETEPSGLPFDWMLASGSGVTIDIATRPDIRESNQRALSIDFGYGRVDFQPVWQLLMLPEGNYKLKGQYKGEIAGRRGLVWRVACADGERPLGESTMIIGLAANWQDLGLDFSVPPGCRAQRLSLELDARSASEQIVSGSIWFDDLSITRQLP